MSLEQAILFLCEKQSASAASPSPRGQVVYQRCPACSKARMGTRDGFVEVDTEELERYEGSAAHLAIDGPTPPRLRRQVLAREGGRCGNPRCHHRADHCHHIVLRSRGGRTAFENEVAVCRTCHALVHAGLLRISGKAGGELRWLPVAADRSLARGVASDCAQAERLPVVQFAMEPMAEGSAKTDSAAATDAATDQGLDLDDLAHGLILLGVPAARSRRIIDAAIDSMPPGQTTEASVLQRALASL